MIRKTITTALFLLLSVFFGYAQQGVSVNIAGTPPDNSAMLDVNSANKGLLIPRVSLTGINDGATILLPAISLLVYNTGTGGLSPAGYFYNSGTPGSPLWVQAIGPMGPTGATARPNHIYMDNPANTNLKCFIGLNLNTAAGVDKEYLGIEVVEEGVHWANVVIAEQGGNVGIGTTAPDNLLSVDGSADNTTGVWGVFSDRRLKKDIEPLQGALETVTKLQGVTFNWKDAKKDSTYGSVRGFIAQDVEQIIPEWVKTKNNRYKQLETIGMDALLVEAIKEQQSMIDSLKLDNKSLQLENKNQQSAVGNLQLENQTLTRSLTHLIKSPVIPNET